MPGENIQDWSTSAANNGTADTSINWAEGQPRASVNNSARSMMAAHAKDRNLQNGSIVTGGSANAQTFTSGVSYTAVPTGLRVLLKAGATNTSAVTLNMDSIGDVAIKDQAGFELGPHALEIGEFFELLYNGTNWVLLHQGGSTAPFDALAYNGMQINGAMDVSQENGSNGVAISGATTRYILDGWQAQTAGGTTTTWSRANTIPFGLGFANSLAMQVNVVNASPAAGDVLMLMQPIEGTRVARLRFGAASAQPFVIGFWILSAFRAGLCSGSIRNGDGSRSYVFTFTINAVNTWEYKTVTIPPDTSGSWTLDISVGMRFSITLMSGTFYTTTPNVWTAGNFVGATGTTNFAASTSDIIIVTGVVMLPGTDAPSAERSPFVLRPASEEQALCERYFQKIGGTTPQDLFIDGYQAAGQQLTTMLRIPTMRTAPVLTVVGSPVGTNIAAGSFITTPTMVTIALTASATGTVYYYSPNATAYLVLDARL